MDDKSMVAMIGIVCLSMVETAALLTNKDGAMLGAITTGIGSIIGYVFGVKQTEAKASKG